MWVRQEGCACSCFHRYLQETLLALFGHIVLIIGQQQSLADPWSSPIGEAELGPMFFGERLGLLKAHLWVRLCIPKWLVLFGFPGSFGGFAAGFTATVFKGTFGFFQRFFLVVLGGFVEFGEAVTIGSGCGEERCVGSFSPIL